MQSGGNGVTKYLFSVSISAETWTCWVRCTAVWAPVFILAVEGSGWCLLPPTSVELAMVGREKKVKELFQSKISFSTRESA